MARWLWLAQARNPLTPKVHIEPERAVGGAVDSAAGKTSSFLSWCYFVGKRQEKTLQERGSFRLVVMDSAVLFPAW